MVDKKYLLTSEQMATFVSRGFLRFDELIPNDVNERAMREIDNPAQAENQAEPEARQQKKGPVDDTIQDVDEQKIPIHADTASWPVLSH